MTCRIEVEPTSNRICDTPFAIVSFYIYLVELLDFSYHRFTTKTSKNVSTSNVEEHQRQSEVSNSPERGLCPLSASADTLDDV